jgi:hypothetical protein
MREAHDPAQSKDPYTVWRLPLAFDLAGTTSAGGAQSFEHFAKGGSWNAHATGRTHVESTASRPALAKNTRTGHSGSNMGAGPPFPTAHSRGWPVLVAFSATGRGF